MARVGFFNMFRGKQQGEGSPFPRIPFTCDAAIVAGGDFPADGQAHARSIVYAVAMQPLTGGKDPFGMLVVKTDTIIPDDDFP